MHHARFVALAFVSITLAAAAGCARGDEEEEAASQSTTSALQASQHGGLTEAAIDLDEASAVDPERAAAAVADRPMKGLSPAGCATKTRDGAKVTLVAKGCTGPHGKVTLDGTLVATFSRPTKDALRVELVGGDDLRANGREMRYRATADIVYEGALRRVTWRGDVSGETKRGKRYDRHTELGIVADTALRCLDVTGSSRGTIAGFGVDVTIDRFRACESRCPASGDIKATVRTPAGKEHTLSVSFDGTDEAHVVGFRGRKFDVKMACEDGETDD